MARFKDRLYYYFAVKNWGVNREYPIIKQEYDAKGKKIGKWIKLILLNCHYRILRRKKGLFIKDFPNNTMEKTRLPYLDGAESELSGRRKEIHFAADLMQYDVISFDIFDTLILRPFANPSDLFMLVGHRLGKTSFTSLRTECERVAREIAVEKKGNREVTIYDIYQLISEQTGISIEKGVLTEVAVELEYCYANPYMQKVFNILKDNGKKIVITSDMYFPKEIMSKLLSKCGYSGYDNLYVSCDYGCSKSTTELYQYLKNDYPGEKIIHVGDNRFSDIKCAEESNLDTMFYKGVHEIGNQYRADGMSDLVGSAYAGIVNAHLHNGVEIYSPTYEYGFIYGGLYVMGFCNWIHKKAIAEGVDKILFLARDGEIYQKVYNMVFNDVDNDYFLWSRIANTKYTADINRDDFLKRIVKYRSTRTEEMIDISSMFQAMSIHNISEDILAKYELDYDTLILKENAKTIEQMFIDNWDLIIANYEDEKKYMEEYVINKIGSSKRIAIIDVGWLGSGPLGLRSLIEEMGLNCEVFCWQAASVAPQFTDNLSFLMDERIEAYLFSRMDNRANFDLHKSTNHGTNNIFFELFTQATHPSFAGFSTENHYLFDIAEVENYSVINEIQNGIKDFCEIYSKTFTKDKYLLNISGHDAYCPYRFIIRDLSFLRKYITPYVVFARGISGDYKKQKLVTAEDILISVGE